MCVSGSNTYYYTNISDVCGNTGKLSSTIIMYLQCFFMWPEPSSNGILIIETKDFWLMNIEKHKYDFEFPYKSIKRFI